MNNAEVEVLVAHLKSLNSNVAKRIAESIESTGKVFNEDVANIIAMVMSHPNADEALQLLFRPLLDARSKAISDALKDLPVPLAVMALGSAVADMASVMPDGAWDIVMYLFCNAVASAAKKKGRALSSLGKTGKACLVLLTS